MKSRRDFLKTAAVGAAVIGSRSNIGLAAMLDAHSSRVVIARDAALFSADGSVDEKRIADLLDRDRRVYGTR